MTAMIKGHALKLEPTDINPLPRFRLLTPQLRSNTTPTPTATDQQAQQESHFYPPTRAIFSQSRSSTEQEKLHFDSQTTAASSRAGLTPIGTAKYRSGLMQNDPRPKAATEPFVSLSSSPPPQVRAEASRHNSPVQLYPPLARRLGFEQYVSQSPNYVSRLVLALASSLGVQVLCCSALSPYKCAALVSCCCFQLTFSPTV
jgi:hypothetical protein